MEVCSGGDYIEQVAVTSSLLPSFLHSSSQAAVHPSFPFDPPSFQAVPPSFLFDLPSFLFDPPSFPFDQSSFQAVPSSSQVVMSSFRVVMSSFQVGKQLQLLAALQPPPTRVPY